LLALAGALAFAASAGVWPQFRGPAGRGFAEDDDFPVHFGPDTNLVWKTRTPTGNSSPVVWEDHVFLTGYVEPELVTLSLDRRTGALRWQRALPADADRRHAALQNPAAPSAVTDGERVWVYFGAFGAACYDLEGNEVWRRPLPTPLTQHGAGASPVLAGEWLILLRDQDMNSELLALRQADGAVAWRRSREEFRRGFGTPLVFDRTGEMQILVPGTLRAVAYAVRDGAERWSVSGLPNEMCTTPALGNGLLFVAGWTPGAGVPRVAPWDSFAAESDADGDGFLTRDEAPAGPARQHFHYMDANRDDRLDRAEYETIASIFNRSENALLAVRPGGAGDVTASHVAWKQTRGLPYVPSPLWYRDRLYLVRNGGIASCFNATNGVPSYHEERLGALGDYYASPVAAGGKICAISQPGTAVVWRAGDALEILARNVLGEPVMATPAISRGTLFVRSRDHLWAFSERAP
jgi:outer membrane protein assembly factor BamB